MSGSTESNGVTSTILTKLGLKQEKKEFTAELAFYETTHGKESFIGIDQRIKEKQEEIEYCIRSNFTSIRQNGELTHYSYSCTIFLEEELRNKAEEVFKPFIDGGFEIINLSAHCEYINEEGIYYISWRNAYKETEKKVIL